MSEDLPRREVERAREACLRLLDYRARSRGELAQRLARKGFAEQVIAAVVEELEATGFLDDEAFARAWVQERLANSPRGSLGMRWELRSQGVDEEIIGRVLATEMGVEQEVEAASRAAGKYAPRPGEDRTAYRKRLVRALRRRGFTFEVIDAALGQRRRGGGAR